MSKKTHTIQSTDKKESDKNKFVVREFNRNDYKFTEEGNFKGSQKDGKWKTYISVDNYIKCLFKEETFIDGQLNGPYIRYYWTVVDSKKEEGFYKNGEKNGQWTFYEWLGNGFSTYTYKNGKQNGPFKHYRSGWISSKKHGETISRIGTLKDGKLNGKYKSYGWDEGIHRYERYLEEDLTYKNGQLHGYCKYYHRFLPSKFNGTIKREGTMKNDEPDGLWKYYYSSGDIEHELYWKDGEIYKEIRYHSDGIHYSELTYKDGKIIKSRKHP